MLRSDLGRRVVRHVYPAVEIPVHFVESELYIAVSTLLIEHLGVGSFDSYYSRRLLRLAGHVARMPMDHRPRQFLTGWVEHARPVGCPKITWCRTLNKAFKT